MAWQEFVYPVFALSHPPVSGLDPRLPPLSPEPHLPGLSRGPLLFGKPHVHLCDKFGYFLLLICLMSI